MTQVRGRIPGLTWGNEPGHLSLLAARFYCLTANGWPDDGQGRGREDDTPQSFSHLATLADKEADIAAWVRAFQESRR